MNAPSVAHVRAPRRFAGLLLLPILVVAAGCSAASGTSAPLAPSAAPVTSAGNAGGNVLGAPVTVPAPAGVAGAGSGAAGMAGSGTTSSGVAVAGPAPAIAYPYPIYPGNPGLAPDNTIVVTGSGQADVKSDMSNRASAQQQALSAALTDARSQADAVAHAVGVTITGVLSVSVSSGGTYAVPMAAGAGAAPGATGVAPGAEGATPSVVRNGPTTVVPVPAPLPFEPATQQLMVSVTVAYRIS
jgi:hypothetical protein